MALNFILAEQPLGRPSIHRLGQTVPTAERRWSIKKSYRPCYETEALWDVSGLMRFWIWQETLAQRSTKSSYQEAGYFDDSLLQCRSSAPRTNPRGDTAELGGGGGTNPGRFVETQCGTALGVFITISETYQKDIISIQHCAC